MPSPVSLLLLWVLCAPPVPAASHSLRYFYSALSGLPGGPQFSAVGYVDDEELVAYSSASRRTEPRAPWMGRIVESDPQYWETGTELARGAEAVHKGNVRTVMGRHNQTAVSPHVRISRRKSDAATTLTCYAHGFYPREIDMNWVRTGVTMDWKTKVILPNTDGTYQIRTTVELPEGHDPKDYRCLVDHISLEDIITEVYKESGTWYIWLIVGVIAAVAVVVALIAAAIWKRRHPGKGNTATNQGVNLYTSVSSNGKAGPFSSPSNSLA